MAPEIFDKESGEYTEGYDIWCLGCLLYELVVGDPPYGQNALNADELHKELLGDEVLMKDYFSNDFKDLLYGLLDKSIHDRISIEDIMTSPFFKKVNWDLMEQKKGLKPSIKPKANNTIKLTKADKLSMQDELNQSPPGQR